MSDLRSIVGMPYAKPIGTVWYCAGDGTPPEQCVVLKCTASTAVIEFPVAHNGVGTRQVPVEHVFPTREAALAS
jgi:hypothetical protein